MLTLFMLGSFYHYDSACEKDAPAVSNAVIIAAANSFFSLIAGFAIFGVSEVHVFLYIY